MLAAVLLLATVSFTRDIAGILAMRCNGCHGDAGGFSTETYKGVMAGGNLGNLVIPGNSEASLLLQYIDGRRGDKRRMPLNAKPLPDAQVDLFRRWIAEGAKNDDAAPPSYRRQLNHVALPPGGSVTLRSVLPVEGYVILRVLDAGGNVWLTRSGAVKSQQEEGDIGRPGEPITWRVNAGAGWPRTVDIELRLDYAASEPPGNWSISLVPPE